MFAANLFAALADPKLVRDPASYNIIWSIFGIICLILVVVIYFLIFFLTRKKQIKTIAHLAPQEPVIIDISSIRAKYMGEISRIMAEYEAKKIKASEAHQELSLVVRRFYAEAYSFKAEYLTLSDLKKSNKKPLADAIEKYYPEEFDLLEKGSVANAADIARQLINLEEVKNA